MSEYWGNEKDANLHEPPFHAMFLLRLQKYDVVSKRKNPTRSKPQSQTRKLLSSHKPGIDTVRSGLNLSPSASTRSISATPVLAMGHTAPQSSGAYSEALSFLIASLETVSITEDATHCRVCLSENQKVLQCILLSVKKAHQLLLCQIKQLPIRPKRGYCRLGRGSFRPWNCLHCRNLSQEINVSMTVPGSSVHPPQARESSKN